MRVKYAVPTVLFLLLFTQFAFGQDDGQEVSCKENFGLSIYFKIDTRQYVSWVRSKDLENTPSWNPAKDDVPPLSVQDAFKTAQEKSKQFAKEDIVWNLQTISLKPIINEKWFYIVEYKCKSPCGGRQQLPELVLIVKMDNSVVEPYLFPEDDSK